MKRNTKETDKMCGSAVSRLRKAFKDMQAVGARGPKHGTRRYSVFRSERVARRLDTVFLWCDVC